MWQNQGSEGEIQINAGSEANRDFRLFLAIQATRDFELWHMPGTASICCSWSLLFLTLWLSSGRKWTVWSLTSLIISGDRSSQASWHTEVMASLCLHNTGFSRAPVLAGASTITQMQNNQVNITDNNLLPTFWADSCLPVSTHPQSLEQGFGFHLHHINKHPKASLNSKCFHVLKQENYY